MLLLPLPSSPPHAILPQPHNPLKNPILKVPNCFSTNSSVSRTRFCVSSYPSLHQYQQQHDDFDDDDDDDDDEQEHVIGDCLVFEQGIFQDHPYVQDTCNLDDDKPSPKKTKFAKPPQVEPQDLVPDNWKDAQKAHNITKKDRRKIAQQLQFGSKLQQKKQLLKPIANNDDLEKEYVAYRDAKLAQLRPVVLDNPTFPPNHNVSDGGDEKKVGTHRPHGGRATPRNPRMAVYRGTLDDVSEYLNSGDYDPDAAPRNSDGPRKLFTREEKYLLNRRFPDLECATSGKWQPLHTLAASGEFYLLSALLKHNVDINVLDKTGLTAIHKAILGKKQAIFNILLRESANPFVRDEEGATLMHYAVRTAASQMIKILLLYNVDINLQDNYGWSPLHLAVQSRRTDIVRLLLIKGADKTLKNREGLTPLELCLYSGQDTRTYELIKLIKLLPKQRNLSDRKLNSSV